MANETYGAVVGKPDFFAGLSRCPVGAEIVASGDYKAVDPASVFIDTQGAFALTVFVTPTANSGGGGVTVTISAIDPSGGALVTLLASVLITGTSLIKLVVDPRISASANVNAQVGLPSRIKVAFVGSGTRTTLTYQASAILQN